MNVIPFARFVLGIFVCGFVYYMLNLTVPFLRTVFTITDAEFGLLFFIFGLVPGIILFGSGIRLIMIQQKRVY